MAGGALLASPVATAVYRAAFGNRSSRAIKLLPWTGIAVLLLLRCAGQFYRELALMTAALLGVLAVWGPHAALMVAAACGAAAYTSLLVYLLGHIDQNAGHRAGAEGYPSEGPCENTVEALEELVERDRGPSGPLEHFYYVEIDVQDTADGHVVVAHDNRLQRAFPLRGPNVQAAQALAAHGLDLASCTVQDLTLAQLKSLSVGGQAGGAQGQGHPTVATLQEFLDACRKLQLHRPLAVEVKYMRTERGRQELLRLLRLYKPFADEQKAKYPQYAYAPFGFLGVIAFPFWFAAAFGEFGTVRWARWAHEFAAVGIPCRSCCFHALSLVHWPAGKPTPPD